MNYKTVLVSVLLVVLAQPVIAETVEVAATAGLTFEPADITITSGDSVHWTGLQAGFHTVAESDDAAATVWNGGFHSAAGASEFTLTFNTAGAFFYICEPHVFDGMIGSITVESPPVPTVSQWGLVVLTLLILVAGGVLIVRRRPVSVSS